MKIRRSTYESMNTENTFKGFKWFSKLKLLFVKRKEIWEEDTLSESFSEY